MKGNPFPLPRDVGASRLWSCGLLVCLTRAQSFGLGIYKTGIMINNQRGPVLCKSSVLCEVENTICTKGIIVFISDRTMEGPESLSHYQEQSCPPNETRAGKPDPLPVFMASLDLGASLRAQLPPGSSVRLRSHRPQQRSVPESLLSRRLGSRQGIRETGSGERKEQNPEDNRE